MACSLIFSISYETYQLNSTYWKCRSSWLDKLPYKATVSNSCNMFLIKPEACRQVVSLFIIPLFYLNIINPCPICIGIQKHYPWQKEWMLWIKKSSDGWRDNMKSTGKNTTSDSSQKWQKIWCSHLRHTVNSPNSGHFGTTAFVLYLESVLYWGVL